MLFLVILLNIIFGFAFPLGKLAVELANPFFAVGLRMFVASLWLITFIIVKHKKECYPQRTQWKLLAQMALFVSILPNSLRFWALQYVSVVKSSLLFNIAPFASALWAYLFFNETLTSRKTAGLVLGFVGMVPPLLITAPTEGIEFFSVSFPELAILAGVSSLAYGMLLTQTLVKHLDCPPYLANATSMFIGGSCVLAFAHATDSQPIKGDLMTFIVVIVAHIIVSNIIGANLQAYLLRHYSTTFISFAGFLSPLCGSLYGWLFFGDTLTWHVVISFACVILGLWLYYLDKPRQQLREIDAYSIFKVKT